MTRGRKRILAIYHQMSLLVEAQISAARRVIIFVLDGIAQRDYSTSLKHLDWIYPSYYPFMANIRINDNEDQVL